MSPETSREVIRLGLLSTPHARLVSPTLCLCTIMLGIITRKAFQNTSNEPLASNMSPSNMSLDTSLALQSLCVPVQRRTQPRQRCIFRPERSFRHIMFSMPQFLTTHGSLVRFRIDNEQRFAFFVCRNVSFEQRKEFMSKDSFDPFKCVSRVPPVSFVAYFSEVIFVLYHIHKHRVVDVT